MTDVMSEDREYQTSNLHSQRLEDVIARQERQIKKQITQICQLTAELQQMRRERSRLVREALERVSDTIKTQDVLKAEIATLRRRCADYQGILDRSLVRES